MTHDGIALDIERFAADIEALPGVSRHNPAAHLEAKSELAGRVRHLAAKMRAAGAATTTIAAPRDRRSGAFA